VQDENTYRSRLERMCAMADIIKVSDEDLEWLKPGVDVRQAISSFLDDGASVVLLTKGAAGVDAFTASYEVSIAAERVTVVDTIGAGDTFNAGFLSGLNASGYLDKAKLKAIGKADLVGAVELANRVAAVTVSRAGANPPWKHELSA